MDLDVYLISMVEWIGRVDMCALQIFIIIIIIISFLYEVVHLL